MSLDEAAEAVLRERWSRSQRYITMFSVVLPGLQLLLCTTIIVLADGEVTWPTALPLIPVAITVVAVRQWLRRQAPVDPSTWIPAAFLTAGVQLLSSAVPAYGIAVSVAAEPQTTPTILFFLCLVVEIATCVSAIRARKILLSPLVAELGSADLRLTLPLRAEDNGPVLVSAEIVVERDRVEWTVRLRGGGNGARMDLSVPFRELLQVMPVALPSVPELRPWITLRHGTTLYAEAGPAILLTSIDGQWLLPVHDAELVCELINRRRVLWLQGTL